MISLNKKNISLATTFLVITSVLFSIMATFIVARYEQLFGKTIYSINYGFGPFVKSIVDTGQYKIYSDGIYFTMHRFPLIPLFLYIMHYITTNTFTVLLIKNCIAGLIFAFIALRIYKKFGIIALCLPIFVFLTPQYIIHGYNICHEEAFVTSLLALIAVLLCTTERKPDFHIDDIIFSITCALFILVKSSSIYIGAILPLFWFFQRKSKSGFLISLLVTIFIFISIASFSYLNNGHFTLSSSINGYNLYKGNNPQTLELYPETNLDILDTALEMRPTRSISDEWDYNDFFKDKTIAHIKKHPDKFMQGMFIKSISLFLKYKPFGKMPDVDKKNSTLTKINTLFIAINRIIFIITSILICWTLFSPGIPGNQKIESLFFVLFIGLYSGPFIIGFAYIRHYIPLMLPMLLFGIKLSSYRFNKLFTNS